MKNHQVVILGGGPAGTCTSLFLQQKGIQSAIVEKENFPRYHIGESFTGETGGQLRKLGMEDLLNSNEYPIKLGTKVYGAGGRNSFYIQVRDRLGPGGSQRPATTWQARRSDFDKLLMDTAKSRGVEHHEGEAISVLKDGDRVTGVCCRMRDGSTEDFMCNVLVDATGQGTFLANRGLTSGKERGNYDRQVAIFAQMVGAMRDEGERKDDTLIFYRQKNHWSWFIPIDRQVVSLGIVVPSEYFTGRKLSKIDFIREEMHTINPELSRRVQNVEFIDEPRAASNYSYYVRNFTGKGWLCVGDSHRFIDPIFSLGLLFATKEAQFASEAIEAVIAGKRSDDANPFAEYESYVDQGQDIIQSMLDCFWEFPLIFGRFAHMTHQEEIVDLFAGRIYGQKVQEYDSVVRMRRLLAGKGIGRSRGELTQIAS